MLLKLQNIKTLLSPPGDTIQETIDSIGISVDRLGELIGQTKEETDNLIKGKQPITLEVTVLLEKALGIPANFWINREKGYRAELKNIEIQIAKQNIGLLQPPKNKNQ